MSTASANVVVRFEGTLCPSADPANLLFGPPDPRIVALLGRLGATTARRPTVLILSSLAATGRGTTMLRDWLIENGVPFDDIWGSYGFPENVKLLIDNTAFSVRSDADADLAVDLLETP